MDRILKEVGSGLKFQIENFFKIELFLQYLLTKVLVNINISFIILSV